MARVIQIKNPNALLAPEVEKVLRAAMASVDFAAPSGFDTIALDLYKWVTNENFFMLIGFEAGAAKSVVMGFFPTDRIYPYPTITMFYSKGSRELLRQTGTAVLDLVLERGYTAVWAVNASGRSNEAWKRLFRIPGKTNVRVLGSVMELSVA